MDESKPKEPTKTTLGEDHPSDTDRAGQAPVEVRDEALEEAARLVEAGKDSHDLYQLAARIRARKKNPPAKPAG